MRSKKEREKNKSEGGGEEREGTLTSLTSLPSPPLLFIAFFTSHRSPLSERLEQAITFKTWHQIFSPYMYLCVINPSKTARNIGVLFDSSLSMEEHIKASCKSAVFYLRIIARIRKHLLAQAAETLIHSLVTSKVDFCNSLLYGVPNQPIQKL